MLLEKPLLLLLKLEELHLLVLGNEALGSLVSLPLLFHVRRRPLFKLEEALVPISILLAEECRRLLHEAQPPHYLFLGDRLGLLLILFVWSFLLDGVLCFFTVGRWFLGSATSVVELMELLELLFLTQALGLLTLALLF